MEILVNVAPARSIDIDERVAVAEGQLLRRLEEDSEPVGGAALVHDVVRTVARRLVPGRARW